MIKWILSTQFFALRNNVTHRWFIENQIVVFECHSPFSTLCHFSFICSEWHNETNFFNRIACVSHPERLDKLRWDFFVYIWHSMYAPLFFFFGGRFVFEYTFIDLWPSKWWVNRLFCFVWSHENLDSEKWFLNHPKTYIFHSFIHVKKKYIYVVRNTRYEMGIYVKHVILEYNTLFSYLHSFYDYIHFIVNSHTLYTLHYTLYPLPHTNWHIQYTYITI